MPSGGPPPLSECEREFLTGESPNPTLGLASWPKETWLPLVLLALRECEWGDLVPSSMAFIRVPVASLRRRRHSCSFQVLLPFSLIKLVTSRGSR